MHVEQDQLKIGGPHMDTICKCGKISLLGEESNSQLCLLAMQKQNLNPLHRKFVKLCRLKG